MTDLDDHSNQPEEEAGLSGTLKRHAAIIIAAIVIFLFQGKAGATIADNAWIWGLIIIGINYGGQAMDMTFKWASAQMINNVFHTATDGHYIQAGGFAIFRNNTVDSHGVHYCIGGGVTIVPEACINHTGRNIQLMAKIKRVTLDQLAPEVITTLLQYKLEGPYWQGYVDESLIMHYPEIKFVINELEQRNKENKMLRDVLDGKYHDVERWTSSARRMSQKSEKGWATQAKEKVVGD